MPIVDTSRRLVLGEIMDQERLDQSLHFQALRALERINVLSGTVGRMWTALAELARRRAPTAPLKVLDVATGAGDVPIGLYRRARRRGWPWQISGCDRSSTAVAYARARAKRVGAAVDFFEFDVVADELPQKYDVVICSLFLHHQSDKQAVAVLNKMAGASRHLLLVSDLERGWFGWLLALLATRLLTTSQVVHHDGLRSVQAAFTAVEARTLAERAGLEGATVDYCWPRRYLLCWRGDSQ